MTFCLRIHDKYGSLLHFHIIEHSRNKNALFQNPHSNAQRIKADLAVAWPTKRHYLYKLVVLESLCCIPSLKAVLQTKIFLKFSLNMVTVIM